MVHSSSESLRHEGSLSFLNFKNYPQGVFPSFVITSTRFPSSIPFISPTPRVPTYMKVMVHGHSMIPYPPPSKPYDPHSSVISKFPLGDPSISPKNTDASSGITIVAI